jgi:GNAT superfamily N-acetyltransferase
MLQKRFFASSVVISTPQIYSVKKGELSIIRQWAIQEGWNPGKYESQPMLALDRAGYWMISLNNIPIGSIAGVRYKNELKQPYFAWLGLYIVQQEYRSQGYGKMLWDHTRRQLSSYPTIGLHAVREQVETYQKDGFELAHDQAVNTRWTVKTKNNRLYQRNETIEILSLRDAIKTTPSVCMENIIEYDARIFSTHRKKFLQAWMTMTHASAYLAVDGQKILGYGVLSETADGYKIAPLFAKKRGNCRSFVFKTVICRT